jgi:adenylate cyclase, class 2
MSGANEIEIKFKVGDIGGLAGRLRELGLHEITPRTHEMNVLFDLPGRPLRSRGELLRLRKYGDTWILTHKSKSKDAEGRHKHRIETETRVENGTAMEGILRALHFESCFRYEKFRAEWKGEQGQVVIDETPIGNFAEIEGPPEWIDSVARELGIEHKNYITDNYSSLFANWKRQTGSKAEEMTFEAVDQTSSR